MKYKNIRFVFFSFIIGFVFTVFIYHFDMILDLLYKLHESQVLIFGLSVFFYGWLFVFLNKKLNISKLLIAVLSIAMPLIIDASVLITNHDKIPIRFPFASIFPIFGVLIANIYLTKKKYVFYLSTILMLLFLVVTYLYIMPSLFYYTTKKNSPKIGNTIFSKNFLTIENNFVVLNDTAQSKNILVENFFVGCIPCEQKAIVLDRIRKEFTKADLEIVYICDGAATPYDKFLDYVKKRGKVGTTFLYDKDSVLQKQYNITGFPFEILSKNGKIISTLQGFQEDIDDVYYDETLTKIKNQ